MLVYTDMKSVQNVSFTLFMGIYDQKRLRGKYTFLCPDDSWHKKGQE